MPEPPSPLDAASSPLCSLGLYAGRVAGAVVGRTRELAAVDEELAAAERGLSCLTLEGEPGIGKTRLLLAVESMARTHGFVSMAVTADEEIRGPFLLARSIFACPGIAEGLSADAAQALERIAHVLANPEDPGLASLPPDRKLLRIFDLAGAAFRLIAAEHPVLLIIDDLQWVDGDSLRLLRYVARADGASRILLVVAIRPSEVAFVNEAVTLLADLERMGLVRRLKLKRFTQAQSVEFLQQAFGGPLEPASVAVMHAQAEGLPFVLSEQAHVYRENGLIRQVDGIWRLAPNAERLLPSAVRTLIDRRAVHLPDAARAILAEAGVLGRTFSLRDLADLRLRLGEGGDADALADALQPAVDAGLLVEQPRESPADYSFTHDQIRETLVIGLPTTRRRAVHGAIVDMLVGDGGEPPKGSLSLLSQHALLAGRTASCLRFSIDAARAAIEAKAPEEVLSLVRRALPVASAPRDRVALLCLQDDALQMLRRQDQRLEILSELGALADALADAHLGFEVRLRRAGALRLSHDEDGAAEISRQVRESASAQGDEAVELAACIELGQDLLRVEMGAGFAQTPTESDLDGAEAAYQRALVLAERRQDDPMLAATSRELGVIALSRLRQWFVGAVAAGEHISVMRRVVAGEPLDDVLRTLPVGPELMARANGHFERALEIFERLGDRQGAMATVIAMALTSWAPEVHVTGSAARVEDIRRLVEKLKSFTKESDRALAEAQMLFGSHVYAFAKGIPDVALAKGDEAFRAARAAGERAIEFAAAGGMARTNAQLDRKEEARRWLDLAATVAAAAPTRTRARRLEFWRGLVLGRAGDADGVQQHLTHAARMALDDERPAERCEALAWLASESARLGRDRKDDALLAVAEQAARTVLQDAAALPGHAPWRPQAHAALARVALVRGETDAAAEAGRRALAELDTAMREDMNLDVLLPAAEAVLVAGSDAEARALQERLQLLLRLHAQRILSDDVRGDWFRFGIGRELALLAGPVVDPGTDSREQKQTDLSEEDVQLLRLVVEGRTNKEIAREIGAPERVVSLRLAELFVRIGASSRAGATVTAIAGGMV